MPQAISPRTVHTRTLSADHLTPANVFHHLSRGERSAFLLESAGSDQNQGKYSFIGVRPDSHWKGSFADLKRTFHKQTLPPGLPPFAGGAVGSFPFELIHELEPTTRAGRQRDSGYREIELDFYENILSFDHSSRTLTVISQQSGSAADHLAQLLSDIPSLPAMPLPRGSRPAPRSLPASSFDRSAYLEAVEKIKQHIFSGDVFQAVISQRFETPFSGDPFQVYRLLRMINPSPYLFFLKQGDRALAGSSPEMLLRVRDRELLYRPIAGTRPRGASEQEDKKLLEELLRDPKEKAEHMMLVDLGRNDLGRVCEYGSVEVRSLMQAEHFSTVMHLTSTLRGRLRPELDSLDALGACFPAGTVSGAPKIRACQIISSLEPCPRGIYSGAIGYLDYSGNLDLCLAIRTIVMQDGRAFAQAGAGIVADSEPIREYEECLNKVAPLLAALEGNHGGHRSEGKNAHSDH